METVISNFTRLLLAVLVLFCAILSILCLPFNHFHDHRNYRHLFNSHQHSHSTQLMHVIRVFPELKTMHLTVYQVRANPNGFVVINPFVCCRAQGTQLVFVLPNVCCPSSCNLQHIFNVGNAIMRNESVPATRQSSCCRV
jgi:hypothetical protein